MNIEPTFAEQELQRRLVDSQRNLFTALSELADHRRRAEDERPALLFVFVFGAFVGALAGVVAMQWLS